ncbi:endonuclease [Polaribacter sp. BAL334]|uniref:endonuclease n=1 Tax=Polaribacter sp. BAL334 TaxID=1708178 RepID=UPI0018D22819|nr:endonuclease [Polaribacter sp. BAL334]MBG7612970.1 endonuclease [Polaribacter sp. BAL334]
MNIRFTFLLFLVFSVQLFSQQAYYNDVNLNLTGLTLKEALAVKIINTHTRTLFYDQIWNASKATDVNPNNPSEVILIYGWENGTDSDVTNDRTRNINNFSGSSGDWNREHVFSRSLGTPDLGEAGPGSDAHHLRPADVQRNSSRGNRKFSDANGNSGATSEIYTDPIDGTNSAGWYPGDEWKGDVARMMMYMYLRYGNRCLPSNVGLGNNTNTPDDMIDLFLKWNAEDPVSDFERQRNTYHENTNNPEAQGNRNPFIDNPRLATRIWGGPEAEDLWGIYTSADNEAPSIPTNLTATNVTTFSVDLSWTASSDNVAVTSYDVFVNGNLYKNTTTNSMIVTGLDSDTDYSITVLAKDIANNSSAQSAAVNIKTLVDNEAPSIPQNILINNQTTTSFVVSWDASTDNTAVTLYDVFVDTVLNGTTSETSYTVSNLTASTTYSIQVRAKDVKNNTSELSTAVDATTSDINQVSSELFFSEYVEGSSNNKALEIVNNTDADIDLAGFSIKRQKDGGVDGDVWENELQLSGIILKKDVYVIINGSSSLQKLIDEADFVQPNASQTNFGAPINFNGNDPVGLFKEGVLVDVIGTYDGGSANFAINKTLRRKNGVSKPNTTFDIVNEWDSYPQDTVEDIGTHSSILSLQTFENSGFTLFPNPVKSKLFITNTLGNEILSISIFNSIGKRVFITQQISKELDIQFLSKGIYFIKISTENGIFAKKFLKE